METPATLHKRNAHAATFDAVAIGETFECNGNLWCKRTSRTAIGVWPACLPEWMYFRKQDVCFA